MTEEVGLSRGPDIGAGGPLPVCDPHHHFFPQAFRRFWSHAVDNSGYLVEELLEDIDHVNVVKTVVIESWMVSATELGSGPASETAFVHAAVRRFREEHQTGIDVAAGIVGFADLSLGKAVSPALDAHLSASERFRGVRHIATWDASPDLYSASPPHMLLDPKFREGFACLDGYGLSFDALVYHPQLSDVVDLAISFPNTPIILEHAGCPLGSGPYEGKRARVVDEWQRGMADLAACSNVVVKLGGLGMPQAGFGWEKRDTPPDATELAEAMAPYYLFCIEQFGCDRCMFESNYPVEKVACSYPTLWQAYEQIVIDRTHEERKALFFDTACRTYRI